MLLQFFLRSARVAIHEVFLAALPKKIPSFSHAPLQRGIVLHILRNVQNLTESNWGSKWNNGFAVVQALDNPIQKPAFSAFTTKDRQASSHSLTHDLDIATRGIFVYRAPLVGCRACSRKCLTLSIACMWMQSIGIFHFCSLLFIYCWIPFSLDSMTSPFSHHWHQEKKGLCLQEEA